MTTKFTFESTPAGQRLAAVLLVVLLIAPWMLYAASWMVGYTGYSVWQGAAGGTVFLVFTAYLKLPVKAIKSA